MTANVADQDVQNFKALIENLDSQSFMAQIPNMKGLGSLSDAEGKKVSSSLQNLNNLRQDAKPLIAKAREAQRLILKGRRNLAKQYGVPDTIPDRPNLQVKTPLPQGDMPPIPTGGFRVIGVE